MTASTAPVRVCVIGAGPSGIAAAKNCVAHGLAVVVCEKNDKVGGNWVFNATTGHSSVYENTHIISSRAWSEYEDYPMPAGYPDYPGHRQLQAYFESYARHFGVYDRIRFNHTVRHVAPAADGGWEVRLLDAQGTQRVEHFTHLMVGNGHHWDPKYPEYPGRFDGRFLHSHDFKGVDETWRGRRVLVIGGGNSACDVAVEAARIAGTVSLSMRSPQWFFPKFIFGKPSDVFAAESGWLPRRLRQWILGRLLRLLQGPYSRYGLPENTRPPLTQHPTLNSDLLDFIRHGRVAPRPAIARLDGHDVVFADGRREAYDIICACTGFWTTFPFFDESFIDFKHLEKIPLYRKMLHPRHPTLYFIGLFQPLGCIWPLADYQARLACLEILGRYRRPANLEAAIADELARPHFDFDGGQRHAVEVDAHQFRAELARELRTAGVDIGRPPAGRKGHYKPEPRPLPAAAGA
ncbi:MAG: NAD(P)-binding domain-containing protein [Gemmatimonadetes bacterium]|nr:NAD(P)-binding domain-containing protein [Gemmatimonadota bacterium]